MIQNHFVFFSKSHSDSTSDRVGREKKKSCSTALTFVDAMNASSSSSSGSVTEKSATEKTNQTSISRDRSNGRRIRRASFYADFDHLVSTKVELGLEQFDDDIAQISNRNPQVVPVDRDDLRKISLLGRGQFCNVNMVTGSLLNHDKVSENSGDENDSPKPMSFKRVPYACKSLDASKLRDTDDLIIAAIDLAHEAKVLSELDHKNIIKLRGLCSETFSKSFANKSLIRDLQDSDHKSFHRRNSWIESSFKPSMPTNGLEGYFLILDVLTETLSDRLSRERNSQNKASLSPTHSNDKVSQNSRHSLCSLGQTSSRKMQLMYDRVQHTALGIVEGMKYLHEHNIVLRDLKPGNVGFDEAKNVQLFDFGMARKIDECDSTELCGSPRYMAPEVMSGSGYSLKVDVYSFGVILFELCTLQIPFSQTYTNIRRQQMKKAKKRGSFLGSLCKKRAKVSKDTTNYESTVNDFYRRVVEDKLRPAYSLVPLVPCPDIRSLIEQCWDENPNKRPSFDEIHHRLTVIFKTAP